MDAADDKNRKCREDIVDRRSITYTLIHSSVQLRPQLDGGSTHDTS
jgi:hypothetical protein